MMVCLVHEVQDHEVLANCQAFAKERSNTDLQISGEKMIGKLSRRRWLKGVSALGALAGVVPGAKLSGTEDNERVQSDRMTPPAPGDLCQLSSGEMVATFDRRLGTIFSIRSNKDPLATNFLGNVKNTRGAELGDTLWTGDVVGTCWDLKTAHWIREMSPLPGAPFKPSGKWRVEQTEDSDDIRKVSFDGRTFAVSYDSASRSKNGIKSYNLQMRFHMAPDHSLLWDISVKNITDKTLEIGELALPLRANDDYAEVYGGLTATQADLKGIMPRMQKHIHEHKVFAHHFIGGHSSYALLQRPRGDAPFLFFHCLQDTSLECSYKVKGSFGGSWIGTDLLAIHSWATKEIRNWSWNPWVNGHTSLILEPGQEKAYQFRFVFIHDYDDIREELYQAGNLGVRILPSMVVQEGSPVHVDLKTHFDPDNIEIHSDGVSIEKKERAGNHSLMRLSFKGRGQKSIKLHYNQGRWTCLHFYAIDDPEKLLKARARFIVERQFYQNPADPYHRNHLFLPFDYRRGTIFENNDDVWEVGGTDDPGFGEPLFLSEKNVYLPSREEIQKLEIYVSDCLFRYIQNPETYEVRASLYWKHRYPSSPWGSWSEKRAEATWRNYNYAFVTNIYQSLYRIGKEYGLLTHRTHLDYLRMSYRTCMMWFTMGPYKHLGLITGMGAITLLEDLRDEGMMEEYRDLWDQMKKCNEHFIEDPYPFSSEIVIDETAQAQVYFFTRFFGEHGDPHSMKRNREIYSVLKAMRGGNQPIWFRYGNDLFAHPDYRGDITCWHSEVLNGMALLQAFEDTGDRDMFIKGYAGTMSVLHNVLPDGMGFAWFILRPGVYACDPPKTFEFGPALWGYLRTAKSYVMNDEQFGLIGCGCEVTKSAGGITVHPKDGLRKRLRFVEEKIDIEATTGEIEAATLDREKTALTFQLTDSTGHVKTLRMRVSGLPQGDYEIAHGASRKKLPVAGVLRLEFPFAEGTQLLVKKL